MKKKNIFYIGMVALAAVSCNVDSLDNASELKGLSFNVVIENEVGTKSGNLELKTKSGEIPLILERVVTTKSVQINDEGSFVTVYDGNFMVEGNEGGNQVFHAEAQYNRETGLWDLVDPTYRWRPNRLLEVVALASESNFASSNFWGGISYKASQGLPSTANFNYNLPEVQNQKDLLIGYFKGHTPSSTVSLKFNHPLTSIQFKVGNLSADHTMTINSISLVDIDGTAHCGVVLSDLSTNPTSYIWDNHQNPITIEKTFEDAQPLSPDSPIIDGDATFIVIPRKFPDNPSDTPAKIKINVTEDGREYDVEASLAGQEWKPGETNVYAISYQGDKKAILTNGPDVNQAMKRLAGAGNIHHIVFEVESDVTSTTQIQESNQWPIYLSWDRASQTITISTSDISIHTGSNASNMFQGLTALEDITGLNLLNTSNCVDMTRMFESCYELRELNLENFNTMNVERMSEMFARMRKMTSLDLRSFDTRSVINAGGMFRGENSTNKSGLTSIIFGENFTLPKNRSFAYTFAFTKFTSLDLSVFKSNEVMDFEYMFETSTLLTSVDLSGLGRNASAYFAQGMFSNCSQLARINFGPNLTFEGMPTGRDGGADYFFPSRNIVVICNQTAQEKLKLFGNYNASRISFQNP